VLEFPCPLASGITTSYSPSRARAKGLQQAPLPVNPWSRTSGSPVKSEVIKTHSGLIAAFSLHLIESGRIPTAYGKSLRQVDQIRLIADYSDEEPDRETAASSIEQANHFIQAVASYLATLL
jgi:HEPN domain